MSEANSEMVIPLYQVNLAYLIAEKEKHNLEIFDLLIFCPSLITSSVCSAMGSSCCCVSTSSTKAWPKFGVSKPRKSRGFRDWHGG